MTKKDFIALADVIRNTNTIFLSRPFTPTAISALADFFQSQNMNFNRSRWLSYIAGECGPNGGTK